MNMWSKTHLFFIYIIWIWKVNCMLVHNRIGKANNLYDRQSLFSDIDLHHQKGYDHRIIENTTENHFLLVEILKNKERMRKIHYLQSLEGSPDEKKIQAIKDLEEECEIRPSSIIKGGLFNSWKADGEFDN